MEDYLEDLISPHAMTPRYSGKSDISPTMWVHVLLRLHTAHISREMLLEHLVALCSPNFARRK